MMSNTTSLLVHPLLCLLLLIFTTKTYKCSAALVDQTPPPLHMLRRGMHAEGKSKRPPAALSQSLPRLPHYYPLIRNYGNNNILRANAPRGGGDDDGMNMNHNMSSSSKWNAIKSNVASQYAQRIAADPNFLKKSILEVCLAASTQFMAEMNRRHGIHGLIVEIDFVVAGILTAVAGKYYSMWRVAPTSSNTNTANDVQQQQSSCSSLTSFWDQVPTNAFQSSSDENMYDITPMMRMASFVKPAPTLFRAGIIASAIGYGLTALLISLRSILVKAYIPKTQNVNVIAACLYTGGFMAVVSNIRYQLLQGVVEPLCIDRPFANIPSVRAVLVFLVRLGNGFLGSVLAISGMRWLGLQKLK